MRLERCPCGRGFWLFDGRTWGHLFGWPPHRMRNVPGWYEAQENET